MRPGRRDCRQCGKRFSVQETMDGKQRCRSCKQRVVPTSQSALQTIDQWMPYMGQPIPESTWGSQPLNGETSAYIAVLEERGQ